MKKYLINGQEVELIQEYENGYLVKYIYSTDWLEDENAEDIVGDDIHLVNQVFDNPPKEKFADEFELHYSKIALLNDAISNLQQEKNKIRIDIDKAKSDNLALFNKLKRYKGLELLEKFIDGKITHYFIASYWGFEIEPKDSTDFKKDLKLLTLFGNTKGDLGWGLNDYHGDSGIQKTVIPVCSYEEALIEAQKYWDEKCAIGEMDTRLIDAAKKYKLIITPQTQDSYNNQRIEKLKAYIEQNKKELEKSENDLKCFIEMF